MNPETLQAFVDKYTGEIVAFTNVPAGSCMAVPHQYIYEVLGLTNPAIISGQFAYEVYSNFANLPAAQNFTLIPNTLTNVPNPGDIVVFGQTTDTPDGHVTVFFSGDVKSFLGFEQDYPYGTPAHLQSHVYTGDETVLGWLHYNAPAESPTQNVTLTDSQITDQLNAEIAAVNQCQTQLKEANATITTTQTSLTTANSQVSDLQVQVKTLQAENIDLTNSTKDLNSNYVAAQNSIISLKQQITQNQNEDLNYAKEALESGQTVTTLQNNLLKIAAGFDIDTKGLTYDQITQKILIEQEAEETLAEKAHISLQVLQELGHEIIQKVEDMSPTQLGQQLMAWIRLKKYQSPTDKKSTGGGWLSRLIGQFVTS